MIVNLGHVRATLLEHNEVYIIPVYQRNYSWTKEQCSQFFDDLIKLKNSNDVHFIGNIILNRNVNNLTYINENIIIDGQQRITTTFILLKAMLDMVSSPVEKMTIESFIFKKDGVKKLNLNIEDDNNFKLLLKNDHENVDKSSFVYINYLYFKDKLISLFDKQKDYDIQVMINCISRLVYANTTLDNNDDAQVIFERINSTGVQLTLADLVRNFLLMSYHDQNNLYIDNWYVIETLLKEKVNAFVNHYLIFKSSSAISDKKSYPEFKKLIYEKNLDRREVLYEMKNISKHYAKIVGLENFGNKKIDQMLEHIRVINQTTCYPFLLHLFEDNKSGLIDDETLYKSLKLIRNYLIRRTITDKSAKNLNKLFSNLYDKVFKLEVNRNNYYDSLCSYLIQITTTDRFPTDSEFGRALVKNNIYSARAICKLLLYEIEHYGLKEKLETEQITIEHIMPQNRNEKWRTHIGDDYNLVHEIYLHTIGNLTLTGFNVELSDYSFETKKQKLKELSSKFTVLNESIFDKNVWNEEAIKARAQVLINKAIKVFEYSQPEKKFEYKELLIPKSNLVNFGDINGTKIASFVMDGQEHYTKDYTELLRITLEELYRSREELLISLAKQNFSFKSTKTIDLSFDKELIKRSKKLDNAPIYFNYNYTPNDVISLIGTIYDYLDLDKETFEFTTTRKKETLID
ncbi:hypothetical protein SCHIN_v1c08150 [Spiroplasma chinense]|uniref:DUF262 domain-containing protein n=1 Tax=Spiroplasma chinense TaxID=216932 RepID=A0A5B9Y4X6_9MOLU|nr:DUF262 domain-containing protein [Spiroplasma chinense]QEH62010.1 hypothetical protein SCHIN_v1c08150 [Spiroplasma chinense]